MDNIIGSYIEPVKKLQQEQQDEIESTELYQNIIKDLEQTIEKCGLKRKQTETLTFQSNMIKVKFESSDHIEFKK